MARTPRTSGNNARNAREADAPAGDVESIQHEGPGAGLQSVPVGYVGEGIDDPDPAPPSAGAANAQTLAGLTVEHDDGSIVPAQFEDPRIAAGAAVKAARVEFEAECERRREGIEYANRRVAKAEGDVARAVAALNGANHRAAEALRHADADALLAHSAAKADLDRLVNLRTRLERERPDTARAWSIVDIDYRRFINSGRLGHDGAVIKAEDKETVQVVERRKELTAELANVERELSSVTAECETRKEAVSLAERRAVESGMRAMADAQAQAEAVGAASA